MFLFKSPYNPFCFLNQQLSFQERFAERFDGAQDVVRFSLDLADGDQ